MISGEPLLISGNAHPALASAIADQLGQELLSTSIGRFPDGEISVRINDSVRDEDVYVIQPTGPSPEYSINDNLQEALVIIDSLRRASAKSITAVTPYFAYARQDRKDDSRVPITAKLVMDQFETAGVDRLLGLDLHFLQLPGFTNLPFDHLFARGVFAAAFRDKLDEPLIVAPDTGAAKMAKGLAKRLNTDYGIFDKDRIDGETTKIGGLVGPSVVGRTALILDDIISTGGSTVGAADSLKAMGAKEVFAAASHGVLCGAAIGKIASSTSLERVYITDTIPHEDLPEKIEQITVAPLFAEAIKRIHKGESVSDLFSNYPPAE